MPGLVGSGPFARPIGSGGGSKSGGQRVARQRNGVEMRTLGAALDDQTDRPALQSAPDVAVAIHSPEQCATFEVRSFKPSVDRPHGAAVPIAAVRQRD